MSWLSTFDFSPGQLLCIASNEQNLISRHRAADDRLLASILPQVFHHVTLTIAHEE